MNGKRLKRQALPLVGDSRFGTATVLERLKIIDFRRLHSYWKTKEAALEFFFSLLEDGADFSVYEVPEFDKAPPHPKWCGWSHSGDHPRIGRLFWNWFHVHFPHYRLSFADQPDFQAVRADDTKQHTIWGDIGIVSPQAFAWALLNMQPGDNWISVLDGGFKHVVINILGRLESPWPGGTRSIRSIIPKPQNSAVKRTNVKRAAHGVKK